MTAQFGTMQVHVACIEWDETISPTVYAHPDEGEVHRQMRADIEERYGNCRPGQDPIGDYVNGPGKEIAEWHEWHEILHDFDGTPWVTEDLITIPIQ